VRALILGYMKSLSYGHIDLEDEKPRRCLEALGTNHPVMWRDIPKQRRPQLRIDHEVPLFLLRLRVES